jgi:DHA1 family bicyclomycin/chloramphenicol resistance-like MFS transporter
MSVVAPGATLLALDLFPHIRGTVASCQSFAVTLLAAVIAGVIAPALSHSILLLACAQLCFTVTALGLWLTSRVVKRMLSSQ